MVITKMYIKSLSNDILLSTSATSTILNAAGKSLFLHRNRFDQISICFLYTHFSLHRTLTYRLKLNIMMLVSAVWTLIPTAPIRIHWWASDVMRNFFRSGLMKKPTHLYLHFMLSTFSANVHFFGWTKPTSPEMNHNITNFKKSLLKINSTVVL